MQGIDSYTKLLLHCDGNDQSTTFTDSATGKAITAVNQAKIVTAQKVFGTGSALFDGTADYLTALDSADWNFGAGAFTIDFRVRFNAVNAVQSFFIQRADATHRTEFIFYKSGANIDCIGVYSIDGATTIISDFASLAFAPNVNTWYHIALIRTGNVFKAFVAGSQVGGDIAVTGTFPDIAAGIEIGDRSANPAGFNGWFDEYRVSKGIARWTANFTPPTSQYNKARGFLLFL